MSLEEIQKQFLDAVGDIASHWATTQVIARSGETEAQIRCWGTAFSIMALLDGEHALLPAYVVTPNPNSDDKEYCKKRGENWLPKAPNTKYDIAGNLHNRLKTHGKK